MVKEDKEYWERENLFYELLEDYLKEYSNIDLILAIRYLAGTSFAIEKLRNRNGRKLIQINRPKNVDDSLGDIVFWKAKKKPLVKD